MRENEWDDKRLFSGFILGILVGGFVAAFRIPHLNIKAWLQKPPKSTFEATTGLTDASAIVYEYNSQKGG